MAVGAQALVAQDQRGGFLVLEMAFGTALFLERRYIRGLYVDMVLNVGVTLLALRVADALEWIHVTGSAIVTDEPVSRMQGPRGPQRVARDQGSAAQQLAHGRGEKGAHGNQQKDRRHTDRQRPRPEADRVSRRVGSRARGRSGRGFIRRERILDPQHARVVATGPQDIDSRFAEFQGVVRIQEDPGFAAAIDNDTFRPDAVRSTRPLEVTRRTAWCGSTSSCGT